MIKGMLAQVSTLLMLVGFPHSPLLAGNGGLGLGSPGFPSSDWRSEVSSPQMNAPAPRCTLTVKSNPEPRMFLPKSPCSSHFLIAAFRLVTASGYSCLTYTYPSLAPMA